MKSLTWKTVMDHRNAIFGFAAIWIVVYHIYFIYRWPYIPVVSQIINVGNMGVDIFVFLSAIGLSFSIEKNSIKEFYTNRVKRVFVPFVLIATPFYIWNALAVYGISIQALCEFLLNITTISFWCREGAPAWYMAFVVIIYAVFPVLYKLKKKHKYILVLLILISIAIELLLKIIESPIFIFGERVISRIPIFFVGMLIADFVKTSRKINKFFTALVIVVACAGFVYITLNNVDIVITRYLYAFMSIAVVLALIFIIDKIQNVSILKLLVRMLNFCGVISLEIYLTHTFIIRFLTHYNILYLTHNLVYYVMIFVVSVLLSVLINKLSYYIIKSQKQI